MPDRFCRSAIKTDRPIADNSRAYVRLSLLSTFSIKYTDSQDFHRRTHRLALATLSGPQIRQRERKRRKIDESANAATRIPRPRREEKEGRSEGRVTREIKKTTRRLRR